MYSKRETERDLKVSNKAIQIFESLLLYENKKVIHGNIHSYEYNKDVLVFLTHLCVNKAIVICAERQDEQVFQVFSVQFAFWPTFQTLHECSFIYSSPLRYKVLHYRRSQQQAEQLDTFPGMLGLFMFIGWYPERH